MEKESARVVLNTAGTLDNNCVKCFIPLGHFWLSALSMNILLMSPILILQSHYFKAKKSFNLPSTHHVHLQWVSCLHFFHSPHFLLAGSHFRLQNKSLGYIDCLEFNLFVDLNICVLHTPTHTLVSCPLCVSVKLYSRYVTNCPGQIRDLGSDGSVTTVISTSSSDLICKQKAFLTCDQFSRFADDSEHEMFSTFTQTFIYFRSGSHASLYNYFGTFT